MNDVIIWTYTFRFYANWNSIAVVYPLSTETIIFQVLLPICPTQLFPPIKEIFINPKKVIHN